MNRSRKSLSGLTTALSVYRIASRLGAPLFRVWLRRRARRGKEDGARLGERFGNPGRPRPDGPIVWIHGVSVGESLSALPLIERLMSAAPQIHVLMTSSTTTSAALLAKRLPAGAIHQFAPIDTPQAVRRFLDFWKPDAALFMESELWPNMVLETYACGVPLTLLNARMSERSFDRWLLARSSARALLSRFDLCLAQDTAIAGRLQSLGARNVEIVGNLKFAADPLPASNKDIEDLRQEIGPRPLWLAASTHDGEERIIGHAHAALKETSREILTILVPRHPERGQAISELLSDMGHRVAVRSNSDPITPDTDIYVADTLGELGLFYRLADIVFVGGSLVPHGGQNPLEPARLHSAILTGPNTENFHLVFRELTTSGAAEYVQNRVQLIAALLRLVGSPKEVESMAEAGLKVCARADSVISRVMESLSPLVTYLNTETSKVDSLLFGSQRRNHMRQ